MDHVVPLSRGGADVPGNKIPACQNCNAAKASLSLEEFRAVRARYARFLPKGHPNRQGAFRFAFEREGWGVTEQGRP